jgi:formyl-CoA transferase
VGNPIRLSASETEITRSPLLGEHTEEILTEVLGYSEAERLKIAESGAIGTVPRIAAE